MSSSCRPVGILTEASDHPVGILTEASDQSMYTKIKSNAQNAGLHCVFARASLGQPALPQLDPKDPAKEAGDG